MINVQELTDVELDELSVAVSVETSRRQRLATMESDINNLLLTGMTDQGVVSGTAWAQPAGAHDSYPLGWQVLHNDKMWESLVTGNVWEPGVSGWREVVTDGVAAWVQPTGAHDAYPVGARVEHNGVIWVSDLQDNVWEPGVYGWTEEVV